MIASIAIAAIAAVAVIARWLPSGIPSDPVYGVEGPTTEAAVLRLVPVAALLDFAKATVANNERTMTTSVKGRNEQ